MSDKITFSRNKTIFLSVILISFVFGFLEIASYFYISKYSETGAFDNRQVNNIFHPFRGWQAPENERIKISKPFFNYSDEKFVETDKDGRVDTPLHYENPDIKIAILGGSTVFGVGSSSNATTVPASLEQQIFDKFEIKAEVTNLGVRGYNSFQELMTLHEYLLKNSADIVIALSGINDAKYASENDDIQYSLIQREVFDASVPLVRKAQRQQPIIINPAGYLRKISSFIDLSFRVLYQIIGQPTYYKSKKHEENNMDFANISKASEISIRNYKMMQTLTESIDGKFIFALQPSSYSWIRFPGNIDYVKKNIEYFTKNRMYMTSFFDALARPAGNLNILDLRTVMDDIEAAPYADSVHYTDLGAQRIADVLSDHLKPLMEQFLKR